MSFDAPRGRLIRIFLVDGTPSGIMALELGNWTGKAMAAPRTRLPDLLKRPEAGKTGIYVLIGPDPDEPGRQLAYIGEGDVVRHRLAEHGRSESKAFFTRVCFCVSSDENLTKTHARFLESMLISAAKSANRVRLINGTEPEFALLPEADQAEMRTFLDHVGILLPLAGFDILNPADAGQGEQGRARTTEFILTIRGAEATMVERGGEFVVLAGSLMPSDEVPTCPEGVLKRRAQLRKDGVIVSDPSSNRVKLTQDVAFDTPSGASSFVGGRSDNGWMTWKVKGTGQTYKDWSAAQIAATASEQEAA
jgi:hypothetical protein